MSKGEAMGMGTEVSREESRKIFRDQFRVTICESMNEMIRQLQQAKTSFAHDILLKGLPLKDAIKNLEIRIADLKEQAWAADEWNCVFVQEK